MEGIFNAFEWLMGNSGLGKQIEIVLPELGTKIQ
jgi:hypothetical protein